MLPPFFLSSLQFRSGCSCAVGVLLAGLLPDAASPHTHCFANDLHCLSLLLSTTWIIHRPRLLLSPLWAASSPFFFRANSQDPWNIISFTIWLIFSWNCSHPNVRNSSRCLQVSPDSSHHCLFSSLWPAEGSSPLVSLPDETLCHTCQ